MANPVYPEFYQQWLSELMPGSVSESLATCDDCAMVKPSGLTRDPGPFQSDLKCCTYFPFVPNFSLGAMLEDNWAGIQVRFAAAKIHGIFLPTGLHVLPERQQLAIDLGPQSFGQKRELLCPFFDNASMGCSVWRFRPGVCTTYFCKSERGAAGLQFWEKTEKALNDFEWAMANEIFRRLGLGDNEREMCKAALSIEEAGTERDYFAQAAWGYWAGREFDFYLEATNQARKITGADLPRLLPQPVSGR